MNDQLDFSKATPEQMKEITKTLSKARFGMIFTAIKFMIGLFGTNFLVMIISGTFLKDVDPDSIVWFQGICLILNFFFMVRYLDGKLKATNDIVMGKIQKILNSNS